MLSIIVVSQQCTALKSTFYLRFVRLLIEPYRKCYDSKFFPYFTWFYKSLMYSTVQYSTVQYSTWDSGCVSFSTIKLSRDQFLLRAEWLAAAAAIKISLIRYKIFTKCALKIAYTVFRNISKSMNIYVYQPSSLHLYI